MTARLNIIKNKSISLMIILFISAGIYSCSSASELNSDSTAEKTKAFSFFNNEDGKEIQYKAEFKDGDIVSLERNGTKINKEDFDKYSDLVYDQLDDINGPMLHMKHFKFSPTPFDTQLFSEKMNHLSDKLSKLKDIDIHINKDWDKNHDFFFGDFGDLDDLQIDAEDINININMDEISSEMKRAAEEIKKGMEEIKKIDFPGLKREMLKINKEIKEAGKDIKHSNSELRKLNSFIKDLRAEMVKDQLIKSKDEDINLRIEDGDFYVNDKKIEDKLAEKYKSMYKEKFGHSMNKGIRINIR
ncbi:MAG: hypothetical protein ACM3RX_05770 [Methanococcaceae archaeon]